MSEARHIHITVIVVLLALFSCIPGTSAQSQGNAIPGTLVYRRVVPNIESHYVTRTGDTQQVFAFPFDACTIRSPDGRYALQSRPEPTTLSLWRLTDETLVFDIPYRSEWLPCSFSWISDTRFTIDSPEGETDHIPLYYDIANQTLEPFEYSTYQPPPDPSLPGFSRRLYYEGAADGSHYLYEQCTGTVIEYDPPLGPQCDGTTNLVIYDLETQQQLYIVTETFASELEIDGSASWSPDGHYLTFEQTLLPPGVEVSPLQPMGFPLRIFDTQIRSFLDTNFGYMKRDRDTYYLWSPDSTKVAFWVSGPIGTEYPIDTNVRQLVIYDTVEARYLFTDAFYTDPYEMRRQDVMHYSPYLVWAPDGSALAFVTQDGDLVYVSLPERTTTILDTNVREIVTWRPNVFPIVSAGPDQTFTDADASGSEPVTLDGSGSSDPDGTIVGYSWTENEIEIATGVTPTIELAVGAHTITLTVTDDDGLTASDEVIITVEAAPEDSRVTDGLQVLYNFAEGEGAVVHDVSGVGTPVGHSSRS